MWLLNVFTYDVAMALLGYFRVLADDADSTAARARCRLHNVHRFMV